MDTVLQAYLIQPGVDMMKLIVIAYSKSKVIFCSQI